MFVSKVVLGRLTLVTDFVDVSSTSLSGLSANEGCEAGLLVLC